MLTLPVEERITLPMNFIPTRSFTRAERKYYTSFVFVPDIEHNESLLMDTFTPEDLKNIVTQKKFQYSNSQLKFVSSQRFSPKTFALYVRENWSYLRYLELVALRPELGNQNTEWELMSDPRKFLRKAQFLRLPERNVPLLGCIDTLHFRSDLTPQMKEYLLQNDQGIGSMTILFQMAAMSAIEENNIGAVKVAAELGLLADPDLLEIALNCKCPPTNNNDRFIVISHAVDYRCLDLPANEVVLGILLIVYEEKNIPIIIKSDRVTHVQKLLKQNLSLARL